MSATARLGRSHDTRPAARRESLDLGRPRVGQPWLALLLLLGACACPPLRVAYDSPEAALATWQAQLCREDLRGEFRCLSAGFQARMGGWSTYLAVRRRLVEQNEWLVWLLSRADLDEALVPGEAWQDGRRATLVLARGDERWTVRLVREPAVTVVLADGSELFGFPLGPDGAPLLLGSALFQHGGRQLIELPQPFLTPAQLAQVRSVHIEDRWKIDDLQGLLLAPEPTP